ncbi:WD repeat protein, human WDR44 family [Schizosaccharomyces pombe]|uniref:Uncharacterized WD repeat-containing protein C18H10.05 n=1 Tax=Schizosaccharomyces pombe (strain 972 / ATCC 24843) TaxID=284812 RepID=YNS5_SCHPO|nr:WD repeat-containing protein [Schizosaccharomyces pombe]O60136.1 RecName: Full=Uncharacterized WD repeat-containing protein C18H10.05 [Schizosaccharomyces pombe 972h-]CAA18402.1 WD repeat protein, human WDR44 family [Schizosaccharomyces pombe]|eukprot:NP_595729.1 WD repeat-containing protein [Schizosaccharomyces pombe]
MRVLVAETGREDNVSVHSREVSVNGSDSGTGNDAYKLETDDEHPPATPVRGLSTRSQKRPFRPLTIQQDEDVENDTGMNTEYNDDNSSLVNTPRDSTTYAETNSPNTEKLAGRDDDRSLLNLIDRGEIDSKRQRHYVPVHCKRMPKKEITLNQKLYVSQVIGPADAPKSKTIFGKRIMQWEPSQFKESVWASEISKSGKYLATAGKDAIIRVWKVIETPERRETLLKEGPQSCGRFFTPSSIFEPEPVLECVGHNAEVLSISWSKNDFLLTSSADRTVRLWHPKSTKSLAVFRHNEIVTCVAFHPIDDRYFVSGSLDCKIQLWSILRHKILHWTELEYVVSTICFYPDGESIVVGMFYGLCAIYETKNLQYVSSWLIHHSPSRNKKCRVTGLQCASIIPNDSKSDNVVLVSTNDNAIRLYNTVTHALVLKLSDAHRVNGRVLSRLSEDNSYIISGSDTNEVVLWHIPNKVLINASRKRSVILHLPTETFKVCSERLTSTIIAPARTAVEAKESEHDRSLIAEGYNLVKPHSHRSYGTPPVHPIDIIIATNMAGMTIVLCVDYDLGNSHHGFRNSKFGHFVKRLLRT